jgi:hypothetical protein
MCIPMVVCMAAVYSAMSELQGVSQYRELIDLELLKMGAFVAAEITPHDQGEGTVLDRGHHEAVQGRYTYLGRRPEKVLAFFDKYMGASV